ncbi:MAG: aspartate-semialdehyde dehydrogenase [Phreatobacter sp.]|uniref:usg protein n=1 Tax=Phreatobacter sp. TaxID=1966341 RepID=UPI00273768E4|nr:aspartate-semialdehyde dehydrogenase [Phreatobacter sp.]MDP2803683.1 aspartate-semialdehyde dehydrogenase [Phreatobacter sp.]
MPAQSPSVPSRHIDADFVRLIEGYSLTTAEILYRMPDHPLLLQTYLWQDYDQAPYFPVLKRFLAFWEKSLDGRLHAVTVVSSRLLRPRELRMAQSLSYLH